MPNIELTGALQLVLAKEVSVVKRLDKIVACSTLTIYP